MAALLAGDVDSSRASRRAELDQFKGDPRFQVLIGGTEGKTILAINNKSKPLDDLKVRQAFAYAIDRKAIIDGAKNGLGTPIGSHLTPNDPGYVDLTGAYPHDPEKAKALLKDAGVTTPLELTLTLPPPDYARKGGEIIAAELADVGIQAKIENVEWAQWLSGVYKDKNFDLTIISHVEPLDIGIYANPDYYFHYDSPTSATYRPAAAAPDLEPTRRRSATPSTARRRLRQRLPVPIADCPSPTPGWRACGRTRRSSSTTSLGYRGGEARSELTPPRQPRPRRGGEPLSGGNILFRCNPIR